MYSFHWLPGRLVPSEFIKKFADLYSQHYGVWSEKGPRPGSRIRLTPDRVRDWLTEDTYVVWATALGEVVGYAITVQSSVPKFGHVAWVTQLVVHEEHRQRDIGKTLLFTAWKFTDFFAWGLLSANPYAVRALEKATRRRCVPQTIRKSAAELKAFGAKHIHYVDADPNIVLGLEESRIDSKFYIDHSQLPAMLKAVQTEGNSWHLGELPEGWEWFAFTFRDQQQISLSQHELNEMLRASDEVTKTAYARMLLESPEQKWATHHKEEVDFIVEQFTQNNTKSILDFGCGMGRHSLELASRGFATTAVDYIPGFIERASARAAEHGLVKANFVVGDCKAISLEEKFDAAICLYDVIGSYANDLQNRAILNNLTDHVKPGGLLLISVMNMELTERKATSWFSLDSEPDKLLSLKPSGTMETTGNVFNPDFYMIEKTSRLVYRKEQFRSGPGLPEEFIVRDRRYTSTEIESECRRVGLEVVWLRFVRAGKWYEELPRESEGAKEILVLCRKPKAPDWQGNLFSA